MKYVLSLIHEEGDWGDTSPEEMREGLKPWEDLEREMRAAGVHVAGEALQESATATTLRSADVEGGERLVVDGPYAETKEQLGGFYLLECDDLDEVISWARKIPVEAGSIEIRPVMDFSQYGAEIGTDVGKAGASS